MKNLNLNLSDPGRLQKVAHALSNELRLKILSLLDECSMNVLELSQRLGEPISTVSNSIVVLEAAELIRTERQSGVRGVSKLCSRKKDNISIHLANTAKQEMESFFINMPIGAYSDFDVTPTCGLLSHESNLGENDNPAAFYDPARFQAQLLWFQQGYVEYRFSSQTLMERETRCLAISFEACSEAPNYRKDWPSDITVSINGVELGTWCCPGDFGGRQGRYTPEWWLTSSTQYGLMKRWKVTAEGCYLDDEKISGVTLEQLHLTEKPYIAVRIGVKADALHQGGINLFGERFGDYNQAIVMRLDCMAK